MIRTLLLSLTLDAPTDAILAWQRASEIAGLLGLKPQDRTRVATAVAEIARGATDQGQAGRIAFHLVAAMASGVPEQHLEITLTEGIAQGSTRSVSPQLAAGTDQAFAAAQRLMDDFVVTSTLGGGTTITMSKKLPAQARLDPQEAARAAQALTSSDTLDPAIILRQQNEALTRSLDDLRRREKELDALNAELQDTNRGVVALYAELEQRAEQLRQADELKSRFLSNMSHEFRTPLNAVLALSRLLLDRTDGELSGEQEKQVSFIRKAAESLTELVNDLLDIAKVEAGKIEIRPAEFEIGNLFGALRGMLRPLLSGDSVALVFDDPAALPNLYSDEAKVSQILRNLISNAIKFTDAGEVRVGAAVSPDGREIILSVADTGIGIAKEDLEPVFEEFVQLRNSAQGRHKGTGLGLPLSKRLATLLGGHVTVSSTLGSGSVFSLHLPLHARAGETASGATGRDGPQARRVAALVVDDDPAFRYLLRKYLPVTRFDIVEAGDGAAGLDSVRRERPDIMLLDLNMPGISGAAVLEALARAPQGRELPVLVITSAPMDEARRLELGPGRSILSKSGLSAVSVLQSIETLLAAAGAAGRSETPRAEAETSA